ncbi:MAG: hypothetical protein Q7U36_03310 [bacterium]|nr:hypothetical protein [bacterium]
MKNKLTFIEEENKLIPNRIIEELGIKNNQQIYFEKESESLKVFEIVNKLLGPRGFEEFSAGQFKAIAGGSLNCSNKIKNYATGKGAISKGFTYIADIIKYCQICIDNSVLIPLESIIEEFEWAKKAINEGYITLHSNGKMRYDIEAIMDITKGLLVEVAFKIDSERKNIEIELNRDFFTGTSNTDEGQDIKRIKFTGDVFISPRIKVQIKDTQYFILISENEFNGPRKAELFISYKVHWKKANTGQRFFRSLGGRGEHIFSDFPVLKGIRAERRGWALREDFKELKKFNKYKGKSFNNDNMYVYWDDLRDLNDLFSKLKNLIA